MKQTNSNSKRPRICTHTGRVINEQLCADKVYTPSKDGNPFNYIGDKMYFRSKQEALNILNQYINKEGVN